VVVGAGPGIRAPRRPDSPLVSEFTAALQDDLDTPRAIRALRRATRERDATAARWMLGILAGTASLS
jgi:hypothetical protein